MAAFVFLGPSLPRAEAERLLDAVYLDPVAMGDLFVLVAGRAQPGDYVAIIDGFFEQKPAVWHKEILFALSRGVHVFGASSMGALRAAELHTFGMQGVGRIFEAYRDGVLEDDDDVAVAHAPAEHGFRVLSDAMASIRFTLDALVAQDVLPAALAQHLGARVKALPYGDRSWAVVIDEAKAQGASSPVLDALESARRLPDAKAEDARTLLRLLAAKTAEGAAEPFKADFTLQNTTFWASLTQSMAMRVEAARHAGDTAEDDQIEAVFAAVRAGDPAREHILDEALLDRLAVDFTRTFVPTARDLHDAARRIAWRHGLTTSESVRAWRAEQHLADADWRRLLETNARRHWLRGRLMSQLDRFAILQLKGEGRYGAARELLDAGRAELAKSGSDKPSLDDFNLTYDTLQAWYEARLGPMQPDPASHAQHFGFANLRSFLYAVLACYLADRREPTGPEDDTLTNGTTHAAQNGALETTAPPERRWRAWHAFVGDPSLLDRLLIEGVLPEVRRLASADGAAETFFIRYWENGYHVRFRVCGVTEGEFASIGERLRSAAAAITAESGAQPAAPAADKQIDGYRGDLTGQPVFAPGTTVEIMYEPEHRRYGGTHAIVVNEQLFAASSTLALNILDGTKNAPGQRQNIALSLTAATIGSVAPEPAKAVAFLTMMVRHWRSFVTDVDDVERQAQDAYAALQPAERVRLVRSITQPVAELSPALVRSWRNRVDLYSRDIRALAHDGRLVSPLTGVAPASEPEIDAALQSMALSQIHMTNNRIGFLPRHEYLFARVLLLALDEIMPRPATLSE